MTEPVCRLLSGSIDDLEAIRVMRNAGRQWFAMQEEITPEMQQRWWQSFRDEGRAIVIGDPAIGYGMLSLRDGRWWVSLAVSPSLRGQGIGSRIYRELAARWAPVHAAIRCDNVSSLRSARKAGYLDDEDGIPVPNTDVTGFDPQQWIVLRHPG